MKTSPIYLLLIFLFLASCQKESPCNSYDIGEPIEVGLTKTISFCKEPFTITFSKIISDSRCPENVVCIWQGLAEVEILVNLNGREKSFLLSTYPPFNNIPSEVNFGDYTFVLVNVLPYPNTTKSYREKDYSIQLLVEKTGE
ncbi:hypothetical protein AAGF08_07095 [Algoriphagus sp. SE2]|uniref:hypothetical protein n=1 Tax=Algoriphagus sp. SE2 TaxID=3141536 RepID=UPI0031CD4DC2